MLSHQKLTPKRLRQRLALIKEEADWGHMRRKLPGGGSLGLTGFGRTPSGIGHGGSITAWKAIMSGLTVIAIELIRRKVISQIIPTIVRQPKRPAARLKSKPNGVSESFGKNFKGSGAGMDSDQPTLERGAGLAAVAGNAQGQIEPTVGTQLDRPPAVMDLGRKTVPHHLHGRFLLSFKCLTGNSDQSGHFRDVEIPVDHRDTIGQLKPIDQHPNVLSPTILIVIPQRIDPALVSGADIDGAVHIPCHRARSLDTRRIKLNRQPIGRAQARRDDFVVLRQNRLEAEAESQKKRNPEWWGGEKHRVTLKNGGGRLIFSGTPPLWHSFPFIEDPWMRIFLFLLTNAAILLLISLLFHLFGLGHYFNSRGIGLQLDNLLLSSAVIGMTGSFISLALSKWMAKQSMGVYVIDHPKNQTEAWLVEVVAKQAKTLGIGMPEVGLFNAPEANAFATGMSRDNALVAVSTGLLEAMSPDEVEAVLGHEMSHVANGDMVTMGLLQGVVNTFVYFLATIAGYLVDRALSRSDDNRSGMGPAYYLTQMVAQIVLSILATLIVMAFSRWREYRADAGGARLAGKERMIQALRALQRAHEPADLPGEMAAFGISGQRTSGFSHLFLSHPPLEQRIQALRESGSVPS